MFGHDTTRERRLRPPRRQWWHGLAIWLGLTVVDALFVRTGVLCFGGFVLGLIWMQTGWGQDATTDHEGRGGDA